MRRSVGRAAIAIALLACGKRKEPEATSPASSAAPAESAHAAETPHDAAPARPIPAYTRALRGKIDDKLPIVMRLEGPMDALEGTYFYEPSANDLHVRGAIAKGGAVHLDESNGGTVTGHFDGTFDISGGIRGTWTDAAHTKSLRFVMGPTPTAAGAPVTLVDRKIQRETKAPAKKGGACKIDIVYPEVVSSFDLPAEAKVNELLRVPPPPAKCEGESTHIAEAKVLQNGRGVLSVQLSFDDYEPGMPHPSHGRRFVNAALPSGAEIKLRDVLTADPDAAILAALKPDLDKIDKDDRDAVEGALKTDQVDFAITDKGLLLSPFNALPHALKALGDQGFLVPSAALDAVRVHPSPVDAVWKH